MIHKRIHNSGTTRTTEDPKDPQQSRTRAGQQRHNSGTRAGQQHDNSETTAGQQQDHSGTTTGEQRHFKKCMIRETVKQRDRSQDKQTHRRRRTDRQSCSRTQKRQRDGQQLDNSGTTPVQTIAKETQQDSQTR